MEFYIALPCVTYSEVYDFYTGSDPKNMITIVAIRTPKEDKIRQRSCQSKIPEKHILRFGHGSFLASTICLW